MRDVKILKLPKDAQIKSEPANDVGDDDHEDDEDGDELGEAVSGDVKLTSKGGCKKPRTKVAGAKRQLKKAPTLAEGIDSEPLTA